jgi:hypothetical protein
MIINNAPINEAIVSNVGEIGEFRIRNSAKAFSILSSGLYANKIRAIIRELSCNAVDSHTAANKTDTPFDIHLPNTLEPWFSIRDYGTGLTHDQVSNIYTTYFESTKTDSNAFIGALGLGSKSPFSYTDNFTVTAIKDGVKGIYTAFINEAGVPSIAKMMSEATDDPSGVEVKFSVNDRYDFEKFRTEARQVYAHFALRPVVTGCAGFEFATNTYESRDIIPGVHQTNSSRRSIAIMGNIAYPIDLPQGSDVGGLTNLLGCGLEMHFAIGELDFQASREGLSYIPQTIAAIKRKLEAVNAVLATKLAEEADVIVNLWERALFLAKRKDNPLWSAAVTKYATDTALPTFDVSRYGGAKTFTVGVTDLATNYNIQVTSFHRYRGNKACTNRKHDTEYSDTLNASGHRDTTHVWRFSVDATTHFVRNDLKTGAGERAKYHYRTADMDVPNRTVFVLSAVDKTKPMKTDAFFNAIHNPPLSQHVQASALLNKDRVAGVAKNVTIMSLQERNNGGYYRQKEMVWRDAGKADSFDKAQTYYYVPLSGFTMQSSKGYDSGKSFYSDVTSLPNLFKGEVYGVRKGDIEEIKKRKNWVNLEQHIETVLNSTDNTKLLMSLVRSNIEHHNILDLANHNIMPLIENKNSPYISVINQFKGIDSFKGNVHNVHSLFRKFAPNANLDPNALTAKFQNEIDEVIRRYPLIKRLSTYRVESDEIAEYINLIDVKKGI